MSMCGEIENLEFEIKTKELELARLKGKTMSDIFDFEDGNGPVPAHRHLNGGGWVAKTAYVAPTVFVGKDAQVYGCAQATGYARIFDHARIFDRARICDRARISGRAQVSGDAWVFRDARAFGDARIKRGAYLTTPISITRSDGHTFTLQSDGSVVTRCRDFTAEEADAHWGDPNHHKRAESLAILNALRAINAATSAKETEWVN